MKVLLINKFHYQRGGAERCYFDTKRLLEENGHTTACFAMAHPRNEHTPWSRFFVSERDYDTPVSVWRRIMWTLDVFYNREAARKLNALIDAFQPDIAHLHNIYHQLSPSVIYTLRKRGIPMVMTLHDYHAVSPVYNLSARGAIYTRCLGGHYYRCVLDRCIKNSLVKSAVAAAEAYCNAWLKPYCSIARFIAPSVFLRDTFQKVGFAGTMTHLPNPLEQPAAASAATHVSPNRPYLLYAGRLSGEKGVVTLLRAWAQIAGQHENAALVIAGDGPQANELRQLTMRLAITDQVQFLGYQSHETVINLMRGARAIVVPSACYENTPYAAREAQLVSAQLICSNVGGLREVAQERLCDVVYEASDHRALAAALHTTLAAEHSGALTLMNPYWSAHYEQLLLVYTTAMAGEKA